MKAAMLRSVLRRSTGSAAASSSRRSFSSAPAPERKVAILGAAGGIGQPLSLLMKLNPLVSSLALYDIAGTPGVAADVGHINTRSEVKGYAAEEQLGQALEGSDVVIIPAGVPRKPGMTRDDLSSRLMLALSNLFVRPLPSTAPMAKTFYAGKAKVNVADVNVPVIGGHAGVTILPLFSQATPKANLSDEEIQALTKRTQDGGTEVVEAKAGKGSATLSMAYAGAIFADACLKGLNGSQMLWNERLGKNGVEEVLGLGPLSDYEKQGLEALKPELKSSIEKGIAFVHGN
ncbi:Malate dehydrogenase, mitochondrial [Sesamum angolense]|uniref:malate dehydrogenase n=1 Tax=Sesamum angolense TaxID=2727404 RepID=A0AAE2BUQ5_9LAMI|nr:Malate dehydrogenase, mitochondrial [Sesamum angolense]